jgi:hypothetical protein
VQSEPVSVAIKHEGTAFALRLRETQPPLQ